MKYTIRTVQKYHIAYGLLPYKRNQDVIHVEAFGESGYSIAVVDGWNNPKFTSGDEMGRDVAVAVAKKFLSVYEGMTGASLNERAYVIAEKLNTICESIHPKYASCVACFLVHKGDTDEIISIGDVELCLWNGSVWYKPSELADHWIDPKKYPSNVSRFLGLGDRRIPEFSFEPDVMTIPSSQPVLFATDGIKDVLPIADLNTLPIDPTKRSTKEIVETILAEVVRRGTQRDDISILVRASH